MLTQIFPSLLKDVSSVDKWSHLPLLQLPTDGSVTINVADTIEKIENAINSYFYQPTPDEHQVIEVAVDTEWNVDITQKGPSTSFVSGKTAVIAIAQDNNINILQIKDLVAQGRLSNMLESFSPNQMFERLDVVSVVTLRG